MKAAGRMTLWAIELSEFDIQYRPRTAIKGQAMVEFITKFAHSGGKSRRAVEHPHGQIFQ